jgi:protein SCO1/2
VKRLISFALGLLLLTGCSLEPALPSFGVVPDFVLTDQAGRKFSSKEQLAGRVWVADFVYTTCPGPCPRMSSQMRRIQDAVKPGSAFTLVSFTVDPDNDTPPALAEYAKRYKADPARWFFLTGSKADLRKLSYDAFHLNEIGGNLEHSTRFTLVDGMGRIRGYYETSEPENIPKLIADIKRVIE